VDPCEAQSLAANAQDGSVAVLAASDAGGLFNANLDFLHEEAAAPPPQGQGTIRKSATENIAILSACLGMPPAIW